MSNNYDPLDVLFLTDEKSVTIKHLAMPTTKCKPKSSPPKKKVKRKYTPRKIKGGMYFIQAGDYIKIGQSSNILKRLAVLQSANPILLKVLFGIYKTKNLERNLHQHFKNKQVRGEWFLLDTSDLEWVKANFATREVK